MTPTREQLASIDKLVKQLCDFVPEGGWAMPGIRGAHKDAIYYEKGDENAPLDSESCTYNLCGKGSGRTLLGILYNLKREVAACLAAPPPANARCSATLQMRGQPAIRCERESGHDYGHAATADDGKPFWFDEQGNAGPLAPEFAPPQATPEPQAMPPIEKGDWVEDSIRIRRVRTDHDIRWWNSGDAEATRAAITEIRKANGTVWTREPRR